MGQGALMLHQYKRDHMKHDFDDKSRQYETKKFVSKQVLGRGKVSNPLTQSRPKRGPIGDFRKFLDIDRLNTCASFEECSDDADVQTKSINVWLNKRKIRLDLYIQILK